MIRTGTILDMDMTSLGAALREGWNWWTGELAGMVPERWRARPQTLTGPLVEADGNGVLRLGGVRLDPVAEGTRRRLLHMVLPAEAVIARRTMLPRLGQRDLARMVALELDRLLPFPVGTAIAAARPLLHEAEAGHTRLPTLIGGMPLARAGALVEAARDAGIEPLSLTWESTEDEGVTLDLLPALIASGAIAPRRDGRKFWWGLVATLFLVNVGVLIGRDVAATNAFAAEVAEQQATGTAARAIAARIAAETARRQTLGEERRTHDPLGMLVLTTRALPEGAWVQRYAWTPETLRLTGTKPPASDIQRALRQTGRLASLQTSVSDPTAESGGGQPFDVSAAIAAPAAKEASQ